jgi:protocatechuate 3,4-dioxygenase, alpha subunit
MYFPGDSANADDPVLALVPPARRGTLVAGGSADVLQWNIVLQGKDETVFFDF